MSTITYPNTQFMFNDGITGSTGTTITPTNVTTPLLLVTTIVDSFGSTGQNGNVLSSTANGIRWIGITGSSGITGNLNMNTYDITNAGTIECTNLNATTINTSTFTNQIAFTSAPSCSVEPTQTNHIVTTNYVDNSESLSNTYSVYNLYLHQSQTTTVPLSTGSTGYSKLSDLVISSVQSSPLAKTITAGTTGAILSFISDPIGITQLPACILNVNIYGNNITGNFTIYYNCNFKLYSGTGSGITINTLGTSQSSSILNNTTAYPLLYTMSVSVPSRTTLPTDRFIIELFARNTSGSNVTLHTYFQNKFYSYAQLQSNNVIYFKLPTNYIVNTATSDLNMNNFNIGSTGTLDISCPNKILSLGNKASVVNIEKLASGSIYLGYSGYTNSKINLGNPLNINYILNTNTKALGYTFSVSPTNNGTAFTGNSLSGNVQSTVTIPYTGVWFFNFSGGISLAAGPFEWYYYIIYKNGVASDTNFLCSRRIEQNLTAPLSIMLNCSGIINVTGTNTLFIYQAFRRGIVRSGGTSDLRDCFFTRIG